MMTSIATLTRRHALQSLAAGAASLALPAFAQWPAKPVRIVVTFPAGGSSDILARVMAEQLGKALGQSFVVDNRPGAGGTIGGAQAAAAPADGYTLLLSNSTPIALGPFALEKQPYDPVLAFTHIAYLGSAPLVIMASKSAGIASYAQLDARARKEGLLNFGSGGPGSIGHIHGELIRKTTGIPMVHVPYRGGAPMTTDLIANVIPVAIDVVTAYTPFFKSGQLVPLAVTGNARSPLTPETPTVIELGQPKLVLENFFGLSAPAGLPPAIVARLNAACNEILVMPQVLNKLAELGIAGKPGSVDHFEELVKTQVGILGPTVRGASIRL